jgi:hypothetical protein
MSLLNTWDNFFIIIGSSSGALIGLTFVAVTLIAGRQDQSAGPGIAAFNTPTVMHFGMVLFLAASLSAPWQTLSPPALALGLAGLAGMLYTAVVIRRQRRLEFYRPVAEDWLWYVGVPLIAYIALIAGAILLVGNPVPALFIIGGVMALLMFIGIRNAWDIVTYIVILPVTQPDAQDEKKE